MKIDPIINGIVIDHIEAGKGMKVYDILNLFELDCMVALIKNVPSKKTGKKDIIKIDSSVELDFDVLGYVAPEATVNYIKDGKLINKCKVALPETLKNVIKCKNPRCITSVEQNVDQVFKLVDKENRVYRCVYCESKAKD
ncbi:MAG: aspartate carbamoyltransferase regulatory subunit [Clostridiales bacterium]|nr:aspartate carbamoyltransferase regulatory subunit [Clostridiales bacterium]